MSETPPYTGPVEALSLEQVCARLSCSSDYFKSQYSGPVVYLGAGRSMLRYPAYGVHEWLAQRATAAKVGKTKPAKSWEGFGDGKDKIQKRSIGAGS
jgi:hypothetical protein